MLYGHPARWGGTLGIGINEPHCGVQWWGLTNGTELTSATKYTGHSTLAAELAWNHGGDGSNSGPCIGRLVATAVFFIGYCYFFESHGDVQQGVGRPQGPCTSQCTGQSTLATALVWALRGGESDRSPCI